MKKLILLFLFSTFVFAQRISVTVIRIKDGDTFVAIDSLNNKLTIRLDRKSVV